MATAREADANRKRTLEYECPNPDCGKALEINAPQIEKRTRENYGKIDPVDAVCPYCNETAEVHATVNVAVSRDPPPEVATDPSGATVDGENAGTAAVEFEPVALAPLPGYEGVGKEGASWCRFKLCRSNQPCKRYKGGVYTFCRTHWPIVRADTRCNEILKAQMQQLGIPDE